MVLRVSKEHEEKGELMERQDLVVSKDKLDNKDKR